ncbi:queuosine precursor transporter [Salinibacter altiplanensis]|uniref:queuosine precursor transporter n=1 Tax=Salinibacter altiplanensis TaxID=1803181 RepID=UPI001F32A5E1|nr:queuosine precursor transporter [Salinibacter altiplanensis]
MPASDPTTAPEREATLPGHDLNRLRKADPSRAERAFTVLAGLFIGALVITNAVASKFFVLFGQELSCGIIAYPVTFLATDLISEIYGRKRANTVVGAGFVVSVFITLVVWIANAAPTYEQSPVTAEAFNSVFGLLPGIVLGSMIAYLASQFIDVQIFEFWRRLTDGKYMWLRNNGSTFFSQLVDTVMVVTIALVIWPEVDGNPATDPLTFETWQGIVFGQYVFKLGIAALDTPVFYIATHYLTQWIQEGEGTLDPNGALN